MTQGKRFRFRKPSGDEVRRYYLSNTRLPPRNCLAARWTGKPISTASFRSFWPENRCRRPEP